MKVGFISLGCSKNLVDSERLMAMLQNNGHTLVTNPAEAEAIFINTCGFIAPAKEEAINTILEMSDYKQDNCKKLIVTGCLAQRYNDDLIELLPEVDRFISIQEYPNFETIIQEELGSASSSCDKVERVLSTNPWYAYLKIAEGCSNRCSFCAIPLIRGDYISYPMEELIQEAKQLATQGVKELVVIAQDTTRYGLDLYGERKLLSLLEELNKIEGLHWIRVLYMYPDEIDKELISGMKQLEKVIPYFDIPLQHGNNKMLQEMRRRGSIEEVMDTVTFIKEQYELPVLRTTMIVGFPGETETDFNDLLQFVEEYQWDRLGAFPYSKEEDTPAFSMDETLSDEEKQTRYNQLMELQQKISYQKGQELIGKQLEVLIESYDSMKKHYRGRSIFSAPDEIDGIVFVESDEPIELGAFVVAEINQAEEYDLYGRNIA